MLSENIQKKKEKITEEAHLLLILALASVFILLAHSVVAVPIGPSISVSANETFTGAGGTILNTSGGYITTINLSATAVNVRWKGFVGLVTGSFTLDDSVGSTLYDWSITSVSGEVYATRNSSTIAWSNIRCANKSLLESENFYMSHTSRDDNITRTFNDTTHAEFFVGSVNITINTCPTLNTYINNASQNTDFEEVALTDSTNFTNNGTIVYATVMEQDVVGFDGGTYDFQMIVPENGALGYSGRTAYYLYVELS
jgi:hypothetical protein